MAPVETLPALSNSANAAPQGMLASGSTFIAQLLAEQGQMTAVENFSQWHDVQRNHARDYSALLPTTAPMPGQQYAFEVDLDKCSGCKACVVACHTLNGLGDTEAWRKVGLLSSASSSLPVLQHVTTACHHCVDPGCLKGCPVLAYEKDSVTGIVRHLDDQCFGCKYCTMMCPYEVPQYSPSLGIVRKCDMCSQRLAHGEAPACVQACPNEAIKISLVNLSDFQRFAGSSDDCLVPTAPANHWTLPTTRYISRPDRSPATACASPPSASRELTAIRRAAMLSARDTAHDAVQTGHMPLVAMLVATQASVGTWCGLALCALLRELSIKSLLPGFVLATVVGVIGVHLALLHLGRPWLAFRSFLGWRTSWLSREAIAFGLYLGSANGALAAAMFFPEQLFWPATLMTCAIGVVAVACSAMIYVATGRALWSAPRTGLEYACTTAGLGVAVLATVLPWSAQHQLVLLGIATLSCAAAFLPKWLDWRRSAQTHGAGRELSLRSGNLLHGALARPWRMAGLALVSSAGVVLWVGLDQLSTTSSNPSLSYLGWVCVVTLFVSQLLMRWLGFASVVYPRMPGAAT